MELSPAAKLLASSYRKWYEFQQPQKGQAVIAVDEVAARVASFYEKIRGVVDWREEHLLRKTAIGRILKRRMLMGQKKGFAEPFVQELIRGGHFPNERIQERKVHEVQKIVEKYFFLLENSPKKGTEQVLAEQRLWLLGIAASEIEETLAPPIRERALIDFMTEDMQSRVVLPRGNALGEDEKALQISVAVERALFKLDEDTITHHLLEKKYQNWASLDAVTRQEISTKLPQLKKELGAVLHHPFAEHFYQLMEKHDSPYLVLGDIVAGNPMSFEELSQDSKAMEAAVKEHYNMRLKTLSGRMRRAAFYSTLSVFLSKVLVAFAIEIPLDTYVTGDFNQMTLWLSIAVPPLLMLLLVMSTKTSTEENFQRLMLEVMKIAYGTTKSDSVELYLAKKRRAFLEGSLNIVYVVSFLISFGVLFLLLDALNFSFFSALVFLFFVSLVAFAGTKIRQRSRELLIGNEKQGFLYGIFDLFALPIIQTGKWLSKQVARYNILVVVFNFLIEIPFQIFIEFLEQWRSFLREKREEVH